MQPEDLRVAARTRSGWEAVDLGFAMARTWWRPIWGAWFLIVVPIALALILALRGSPWWTLFILWWLRPLFGRVVLHVLGEALFGEPPSPFSTARALPRALRNGLLASLSVLRLSPDRCYALAVLQLEGSRGAPRRERTRVLTRADLAPAVAMHAVMALVDVALILALFGFVYWLAPGPFGAEMLQLVTNWLEGDTASGVAIAVLYLAGISVAEPLLVAGGFGLYLNRRVWLEGWDVEIALRRLGRRLGSAAAVCLALTANPAGAACIPDDATTAAACVEEILEHEDFGRWHEVDRWIPRDLEFGEDWNWPEWSFSNTLGESIAGLAEIALWIGLAVAGILIVVRLAREAPRERQDEPDLPLTFLGLDLDPEALPADVIAAARARFAAGDPTGALSLVYRGALVQLVGRGLEIPASATEGDCLRLVREVPEPGLLDDFRTLNDAWMLCRYGRTPIASPRFEALCERWARRLSEPTPVSEPTRQDESAP